MKLDFRLKVDPKQFEDAPKQYEKALSLAISFVSRWANKQVLSRLPKATGLQMRVIKGRVRLTILNTFGAIFVGLDPISARRLNPRQVSGGVEVAGKLIPNAFIIGGTGPLSGQVMVRRGAARLPIDKQTVDIQPAAQPEVEKIAAEVNERLMAEFERQYARLTR